jgi:hypothetical protein
LAANNGPSSTPPDEALSHERVLSRHISRAYDHAEVAAKRVAPY